MERKAKRALTDNMRRLLALQLLFLVCMLALVGRLLLIQSGWASAPNPAAGAKNRSLTAAAVGQREQSLVLDPGRGHFYDRKGRPLTGDAYETAAVFPAAMANQPADPMRIGRLLQILGTSAEEWNEFYRRLERPSFWIDGRSGAPIRLEPAQADALRALALPGVFPVPYVKRYYPDAPAGQLIGYVGQHPERLEKLYADEIAAGLLSRSETIGASGLELTFDAFLRGNSPMTLSYLTDAVQRPLSGTPWRLTGARNPFYPVRVVTTLDLSIQRNLERILDAHGVAQGAVVVLDANNADVVAMASRPAFDPGRVDLAGGAWANRALKTAAPGSVFKTAIAAAALEYGAARPGETFFCSGELGRYGLSCWKAGGHGRLALADAYAESCNVVFATLGERLTAAQIEAAAAKLGLVGKAGWRSGTGDAAFSQFDHEEEGRVFIGKAAESDAGVRAQSAIGQRDVRLSPLAAANMVVTLLNGGRLSEPRVVREIRYRDGLLMTSYPVHMSDGNTLDARTASALARWMVDTVERGTGASLAGRRWKLAGKSGTALIPAAAGWGENEWFVGYGPVRRPKYAVAVLVQKDREDAAHTATRLFGDIMDMLAREHE